MTLGTMTYPKLAGHDDEENAIWMFDEDEELPKEEDKMKKWIFDGEKRMYEDELPADLPKELYDWWYDNSRLDGVRFGPSIVELPPGRVRRNKNMEGGTR